MFQAVIFDFFGTLTCAVRRGRAHDRIASRLGCDPYDFAQELDSTFVARSVGALGDPETALATVASRLGVHPGPVQLRRAVRERVAAVAADTRLRPEAVPVVQRLRRDGLAIGLISDCGPELPEFLPHTAIAPLLDTAVFSIEAAVCKPDPEIFLMACARLSVEPSRCLYVGDGGSHELTGATAVGMTAVQLAAPDLGEHLAFERDPLWTGPRVTSLWEVHDMLARTPLWSAPS